MNEKMTWTPVSESRAEIVRFAMVLTLGLMAVVFVGSLAKAASRVDHRSAAHHDRVELACMTAADAYCY
jgi:hypothetical protein